MTDTPASPPRVNRRTLDYSPYMTAEPRLRALVEQGDFGRGLQPDYMREACREVLPYEWHHQAGFQPVVVSPDEDAASELIIDALAVGSGERSLDAVLRTLFTTTADALLRRDRVYCEIAYTTSPDHSAELQSDGFRLLPVPLGTVRRRRGHLVQYVPARLATQRTRRGVGFIDLEDCALAVFEIDERLGRQVRYATTALASHDAFTGMLEPDVQRAAGADITAATAEIGWNGRVERLWKGQLIPYQVWRDLQCLAFKIKLRESILMCLNSALTEAGLVLDVPMKVELHDVTTLDQVHEAQRDLVEGRRNLDELRSWALQ